MRLFAAALALVVAPITVHALTDTLLTIEQHDTKVHMIQSASDQAKRTLSTTTCSATKRDTLSNACLLSTTSALLRDTNLVSILMDLYHGNPIPGTLKSITSVPAFASAAITTTFIDGLPVAANFLSAAVPGISTEETIWIYYTMMDMATEYLSHHPTGFLNFATARAGNMPAHCPNVDDNPCGHTLCQGGADGKCTGFLAPCACNKSKCGVTYSKTELKPFCESTVCMPVDPSTGLCTASGKYKHCSCSGDVVAEGYTFQKTSEIHALWAGPDWTSAPAPKKDATLCYKVGDSTHTKRTADPKNWMFVEQSVLDKNIETFCKKNGAVKAGTEAGVRSHYNLGTLNEVIIGFDHKQGATQSVADCTTNLKRLSADCDSHPVDNQFNWKWGGEFTHGLFTYIINPQVTRVAVRHDPDTDWWRVGDSRHYWNNGKKKTTGTRYGKNGKPLDMVILTQCLHHLKFLNWNKGAPQDCAGLVNFSGSTMGVYSSWQTCWEQTWKTTSWKFLNEDALCGYSNHRAGAGKGGIKCWMGVDCWKGA